MNFRAWLRRAPLPARLRVDGRDVAIAQGPKPWVVTEETVRAMNGSRVEAIGPDGVCLRACTLDEEPADDAPTSDAPSAPSSGTGNDVVVLALKILADMPRVLSEAHDAGARRHAEAYSMAFRELTGLVTTLANRLGSLEVSWQKAMQTTARAQADAIQVAAEAAAAGGDDPAGAAVQAMLINAMTQQNGAPAAAKAQTNGKAK